MIPETIVGMALGAFGAIPFIHTNLILQMLHGLFEAPGSLAAFAIAVSVSHSFFSLMPSMMVVAGFSAKNFEAFEKAAHVAMKALVICLILLPAAYMLLPLLKDTWKAEFKFLFLSIVVSQFIGKREVRDMVKGAALFLLCGIFGILAFHRVMAEPLFPMLSGFFALPALLMGEMDAEVEETAREKGISNWGDMGVVVACVIASALSTLFPAMTVGVLLGLLLITVKVGEAVPIALPALIVSKVFFDLAAGLITGDTRSYAAVLVEPLFEIYGIRAIFLLCAISLTAACFAAAISARAQGAICRIYRDIQNLNTRRMLLLGMLIAIFIMGGFPGLLIASTSCLLGIAGRQLGVKRGFLMGALLLPALIFHFGAYGLVEEALFG
ncbi:MAG: hypothetical protein ABH863_05885 [Candidatus Micrarchaeota archaeon]